MKSKLTRRQITLALAALSLGILVGTCVYVAFASERVYEKAARAHHAEPPLGQTALRQYDAAIRRDETRRPAAMLQKATILDHGILQGPEPVLPDPSAAIGYYRQVAVMGVPRDRALARDRLVELGDRVFVNPPPRRQMPVAPQVPPPAFQAADIVELRIARGEPADVGAAAGPRSDSQNVHDSSVVRAVKAAVDRMGPSPVSLETTLVDVRRALEGDEHGLKGLDLIETNTVPLAALKMTEVDVLRRVWGRIQAEPEEARRTDMANMLKLRLKECGQEASCASGRVARVVDALSTFDEKVQLRPLWALRQEMLAKAGALRAQRSDDNARPFAEVLREQFTRDYVTTGLVTANVLDAELASWGQDLD